MKFAEITLRTKEIKQHDLNATSWFKGFLNIQVNLFVFRYYRYLGLGIKLSTFPMTCNNKIHTVINWDLLMVQLQYFFTGGHGKSKRNYVW